MAKKQYTDQEVRDLYDAITYGDEEQGTKAIREILGQDEVEDETNIRLSESSEGKRPNRAHQMEVLSAKVQMDNERSAAEQGSLAGIARYFCFRHPGIAENPELYSQAEQKVQALIDQRKTDGRDYAIYDQVARQVYKENSIVPEPLNEEHVLGMMKKLYAPLFETPTLIDPPRLQKETATVPELIQRRGAINSMIKDRRKKKYAGQGE